AEDGIRDPLVTGVQTCALPIYEGRAMLQIIHDVAPKSELAFRTGVISEGDFAEGIKALQQDSCDIIVDDITFITAPFFQDGVVRSEERRVGKECCYGWDCSRVR